MEREKCRRIIFYKDYFQAFFVRQSKKVRAKIVWTLELVQDRLVVLVNGFQKKTQKTPIGEIDLALKIKKEYESEKHQYNNI